MKTGLPIIRPFLAGVVLSLVAVKATSAETVKPQWDGLYGGLALGGAFSEATPDTDVLHNGYFLTNASGNDEQQLEPILNRGITGWDVTGSAFLGYERQVNDMTYGIEGDLTAMAFKKSRNYGPEIYDNNAAASFTTQTTVETDFTLSLRPKIGYVVGDYQFHVGAGPSISRFKTTFQFSDTVGGGNQLTSVKEKTAFGISSSIGAGYQIGDSWSLRGDYVFTYFPDIVGGDGFLNNDARPDFDFDGSFQSHNVRLSVIKHF